MDMVVMQWESLQCFCLWGLHEVNFTFQVVSGRSSGFRCSHVNELSFPSSYVIPVVMVSSKSLKQRSSYTKSLSEQNHKPHK
jgi:hypothetical protein